MTDARTVPMLPCGDVDEIIAFYQVLGFEEVYRQLRPNPYVIVRRGGIELHFFGLPDFKPEDSYGSCGVYVPLFESFAAGMRAEFGKILVSGIPRMTRPRKRKNDDRVSGFSVVDPGGNWIRIFNDKKPDHGAEQPAASKVAQALESAVVLGDSKGDPGQAAKILDATLARHGAQAPAVDRVEALVYRTELAVRLGDRQRAAAMLAEAGDVELTDDEQSQLTETLASAADFRRAMARD
jgi:hypothetical protein